MSRLTWKVWDPGDTTQPLAEGTEEICRTAVVALSLIHPGLILEDAEGREWVLRPAPQRFAPHDDPPAA